MDRFFESKPVVYMSKFFDMVLLNVIFVISCIPIVTIGAACTALYYTCVKVIRRDRSKLWKEYKQSFVDNFKTSVGIWIPLVLTETALTVVTYRLLSQGHTSMSAAMIGICMAFFLFILEITEFPPTFSRKKRSSDWNTIISPIIPTCTTLLSRKFSAYISKTLLTTSNIIIKNIPIASFPALLSRTNLNM